MTNTRQVIGKRRLVSSVQARGVERRIALIQAAHDLMENHRIEDISFREIAGKAGVPESSAYHFYANKYDLFSAVASEMLSLFLHAYNKPIPSHLIHGWQDILDIIVERAIEIFRSNAVARELLVGSKTPPEIKPDHSKLDAEVYLAIAAQFSEHFELPDIPDLETKLKYASVIFDSLVAVGLREHGEITDSIVTEAQRACRGYLSTYFPAELKKREETLPGWGDFPL